jgi:hypothetical protein
MRRGDHLTARLEGKNIEALGRKSFRRYAGAAAELQHSVTRRQPGDFRDVVEKRERIARSRLVVEAGDLIEEEALLHRPLLFLHGRFTDVNASGLAPPELA